MLFNSYEFILLFLPIVLGLYYLGIFLGRAEFSRLTLLLGSLFFYGYWDMRYLPLLLFSIGFNYLIGRTIAAVQSPVLILNASSAAPGSSAIALRLWPQSVAWPLNPSKAWLFVGISLNLLLLFTFKYSLFALSTMEQLFGWTIAMPILTLPLGISFFTFTQIAFLVDAYHRKTETLTPTSYGLFVTVFPHLIAGPILHHREMMGQFQDSNTYRWNTGCFSQGLVLFTMGLAKKVLIADPLAPLVQRVFDVSNLVPTFLDAWGGAMAYTLQLYFDFSGYSDMAIGLGLLFNMRLPINFDSPYKAKSIIEFWRRWHMTLSAFLRDYLYIPLGGNRGGQSSQMLNLFLTMLLGGLWHGAGWTFVLWGALQGVYLVINHLFRAKFHFPTAFSWPLTLFAVIVGWVIFRSVELDRALTILQGMFGFNGIVLPVKTAQWLAQWPLLDTLSVLGGKIVFTRRELRWLLLLFVVVLTMPNSTALTKYVRPSRALGVGLACVFVYCIMNFSHVSEFLYYQF